MTDIITEARELCAIDIEKQPIHAEVIIEELCDALEKAEAEANFWKSKFKTLQQCDIHNLTDCDFCQTLISANAEVERLREAQRWVPMGERLPTEKDADRLGFIIAHSDSMGQSTVCVWYQVLDDGVTSHWMPLPSPPEKGVEHE